MNYDEIMNRYLTEGEEIQQCVKQRVYLGVFPIKPNCIVVTNRRFLIIYPTLFSCSFEDMLWLDIANVHLKEKFLTASLSCTSVDGRTISLDKLVRDDAVRVYKVAQLLEEQMREFRRQLDLQKAQAGAANLNVSTR